VSTKPNDLRSVSYSSKKITAFDANEEVAAREQTLDLDVPFPEPSPPDEVGS